MAQIIIFSLISLVCLGMSGYFGYILWKSIACFWWPHTMGRILGNGLKQTGRAHGVPIYGTRISYAYAVAGEEMIGRKVDFVQYDNANVVKLFTSGKYYELQQVKVYYNPKKPSEAVLERGPKLKYIWPFFCGLLFPVVAVCAFIYGRD